MRGRQDHLWGQDSAVEIGSIHGQSNGNDNGSLSSKALDAVTDSGTECGASEEMQVDDLITLDHDLMENLRWWKDHLLQWNGHGFLPQRLEIDVYMDASQMDWGLVYANKEILTPWNKKELGHHIN